MLARVPDGPLHGTLVIAYDQQIAGSLAAEELARGGATVIKIEKREGGDPKRHNSTTTAFNTFNAGKSSIAFSDSPEDRELKTTLLRMADVVIDNRSESTQERDEALQEVLREPRVKPMIFCAISGFGRGSKTPAYDRAIQAASGMVDMNGKLIPFPIIDMATGKEAAREIANHLFYRERLTPSQCAKTPCIRLDISMIATALNMMANTIATYLDNGRVEPTIVPFDLYEAQNGRIAVAVATDQQFQILCDVLNTPDLKCYETNAARQEHKQLIEERLHAILPTKTMEEWNELLTKQGISVSPVVSLAEAIRQHGRDVIKTTNEGGMLITGPMRSSVHPNNPRIGNAPRHDGDREAIIALTDHLTKATDRRALEHALEAASNAPDKSFQNKYALIDPYELDFTQPAGNLPWAYGKFFSIRKIGEISAEPAIPGEIVDIVHDEHFLDKRVALEGDWKITTSYGDHYLHSSERFHRNYVSIDNSPGRFAPNPELPPRKAIKVMENVRFMTSSNDTSYIPKGGWIVLGSKGPYGIHPNNITGNYEVSRWVDASANRAPWALG